MKFYLFIDGHTEHVGWIKFEVMTCEILRDLCRFGFRVELDPEEE